MQEVKVYVEIEPVVREQFYIIIQILNDLDDRITDLEKCFRKAAE